MSDMAALERRYRLLLALYPRAFRLAHDDEVLAVLMAGAVDGRRRPGLAESADLIRSAIVMRLRAASPRNATWASRLMCIAAALELACVATVLATLGAVKADVVHAYPGFAAHWHAYVATQITPLEFVAPIIALLWLALAWGNARDYAWARVGVAVLFALTTFSLLAGLAQGSATYAPADLIAGTALWLAALGALVLTLSGSWSGLYHRHDPLHA